MLEEMIVFFIQLCVMAAVALVFSLLMHELGHLFGGLWSGYHLVYFSIFGFIIWGKRGRRSKPKTRYVKKRLLWQCVMAPEKDNREGPLKTIRGGIIASIALIAVSLISIFLVLIFGNYADGRSLCILAFLILLLVTNIAFWATAWRGKDPTADGNTYRLVNKDRQQARIYDKIAILTDYLSGGMSFGEILADESLGEDLFDTYGLEGSLAEEMQLYELAALLENEPKSFKTKELADKLRKKLSGGCYFEDNIRCEIAIRAILCNEELKGEENWVKTTVSTIGNAEPSREYLKALLYSSGMILENVRPGKDDIRKMEALRRAILLPGQFKTIRNMINAS